MKRLTITPAGVVLLATLAGACTGDVPSAAAPTDPALARAPAGYTVLNVGALLGNYSSVARAVNDAGDVAGYCCEPNGRAFALVSGAPVFLGGASGSAWGLSNGNPAFAVGRSDGLPVRWSLATPAQPTFLERTSAEAAAGKGGTARGVNAAGAAVGDVARVAAMWTAAGYRIENPIATPAGFAYGEGRGINDDGLAIFQFSVAGGDETTVSRAYVRLASGVALELPPAGTDVSSFANDIGEVGVGTGLVYVAGTTRSSELVSRAVRWTVDVVNGTVAPPIVIATTGAHGLGVSDAGGIAGFVDVGSFKSHAYLWRGAGLLTLNPPKGLRDGKAWAMSRSGRYVAGQAMGIGTQAVRWTIAAP